ncbi:hypothetical protein [Kordia sp.]|uniref:hypothetical protein n=1 Tax=Kordia sp. TaxID=1965332 RepID=UPI0025C32679|nr:hypothetical protein [Kordia sp.]MCH2195546.1 hypothetical protein [Kordia sp.]
MSQSNSNLLNYISLLMHDDDALHQFLIDPIQAEKNHGITKAERAVLRRTVAHLSNKSKNGYTVARHAGSYRRSLRLLQNVLHNVGSKMHQDASHPEVSLSPTQGRYSFSMIIYFPHVTTGQYTDFTCKNNAYLEANYGSPYSLQSQTFTVRSDSKNPTIQEVMDLIVKNSNNSIDYVPVKMNGEEYVKSISHTTTEVSADISNVCYNLDENPNADSVFWFYSVNGKANPITSGVVGEAFSTFKLRPNDTVFWQLIAPDKTYGFQPCAATKGNANTNS